MKRSLPPPRITAVIVFAAIFSYCAACFAEIDPTMLKLKELATGSSMAVNKSPSPVNMPLLDNSIDQDSYYLGGGDAFVIHILELPSVEYIVVVDQNCDLVIPDLGIVRVGKQTLTNAKKILVDFVRSKLKKNYEVYVALIRAKSAIITVSGDVTNPGTYQVEGTSRLLDAVRLANDHKLPVITDFNYREVRRTNHDSSEVYDLFQFIFLGDKKQNPYVYPGDNIGITLASRRVVITGCVRSSSVNYLPIKPNETVKEFVSLFTLEACADSDNILVAKHDDKGAARTIVFSLNRPENIALGDRDIIAVTQKSDYPRVETVWVSGEINRPGNYALIPQATTASSLIEQAGGPTRSGNINKAFIIRWSKVTSSEKELFPQNNTTPSPTQPTTPITQRPIHTSVRPEITPAVSNLAYSKDYSIILLKNIAPDQVLEPNDEVVVPRIDNFVYVSGSVRSPGAYPFVKGKSSNYFIKKAGGLTSKGDKSNVCIMAQYGEAYQIKENRVVEEGDVIVVPESQQYNFLKSVVLPVINVFLTTLSTVFVIYSVTK